jgi:hypothetical protein
MMFMLYIRSLYSPMSRSMKDLWDNMEIWKTEWLQCLECRLFWDGALNKVRVGCMKTFGSLEDILAMIVEGDQGIPLRTRVHVIRQDANHMQTLRSLWEDEGVTTLMDSWVR